jgi:hypothetical protein
MFSKINPISDKEFIYIINRIIIILSIFLLRLPIALGYRYNIIYRSIVLILIFVTLIFNVAFIHRNHIKISLDKYGLVIFSLFILFWIQALLRFAFHEINFDTFFSIYYLFTFLILGFFVFTAFWANPEPAQIFHLKKSLIYAFGLYITMNVILFVIGIDPKDQIYLATYPSQMLGYFHIQSNRILFPMADGINAFGLLAGAVAVGDFQLLKLPVGRTEKIILIFLLVECFCIIILTDSRGALLFSILSVMIISLPRKLFRFIRWSPFIISFLPLLLVTFLPNILSTTTSWLNRPRSEWGINEPTNSNQNCQELLNISSRTLSNRPIIWSSVIGELKNFTMIQLVGYGFRGQVISNISESYSCLFASFSDSLLASAHNIWLQLILDIGYIGLIITIGLILYLNLRLTRIISSHGGEFLFTSLVNILLYILLIGSLEAPISPDFFCLFSLVIFISLSTFTIKSEISDTEQVISKVTV